MRSLSRLRHPKGTAWNSVPSIELELFLVFWICSVILAFFRWRLLDLSMVLRRSDRLEFDWDGWGNVSNLGLRS